MNEQDLLPPSVDPNKKALGIRRVSARNEAATRTVMMVRDHVLVTDEKGTNTGPTPLEMALSSLLGCEGVIINRCAEAMRFKYSAVDLEADGEVDQRGSRGRQRRAPLFQLGENANPRAHRRAGGPVPATATERRISLPGDEPVSLRRCGA